MLKLKIKFKINDKFIYICALILAISLFSLFHIYYLSHSAGELSALFSQKSKLEKQLETKNHNLSALSENLSLIEELQNNAAPRQIPAENETDAILGILRLIGEYGLTESDFKILARVNAGESGYLRPLQLDLTGNYHDCMRFLYAVQHGEYYCLPERIEMKSRDADYGKIYLSACVYLIVKKPDGDFYDDSDGDYNVSADNFDRGLGGASGGGFDGGSGDDSAGNFDRGSGGGSGDIPGGGFDGQPSGASGGASLRGISGDKNEEDDRNPFHYAK